MQFMYPSTQSLTQGLFMSSKLLGKMSPEDFAQFCHEQRDLRIERNEAGEIEIMAPAYSLTGRMNAEINYQLSHWNRKAQLGLVFDSSAGFFLDEDKEVMRSPDAAFVSQQKFDAISQKDRKGFLPICPDFLIELKSASDSLHFLQQKMERYMGYGCQLGWLIDPDNQIVYIYHADGERDVHKGFDSPLSASSVLPGFELDLAELPLENK